MSSKAAYTIEQLGLYYEEPSSRSGLKQAPCLGTEPTQANRKLAAPPPLILTHSSFLASGGPFLYPAHMLGVKYQDESHTLSLHPVCGVICDPPPNTLASQSSPQTPMGKCWYEPNHTERSGCWVSRSRQRHLRWGRGPLSPVIHS